MKKFETEVWPKIREPWASGFGYGGLAKKIYCRDRSKVPMSVSDPISRVIELVVNESLSLPLTGKTSALKSLYEACGSKIEAEFVQWAKAREEIRKLEESANG